MATDATPFQTPPKMARAAALSSSSEYAVIWTGQSNSRPWGYVDDGIKFAQELRLEKTGADLTSVTIPDNPARYVGMIEELNIAPTQALFLWNTSTWLRLGTPSAPQAGYAKVLYAPGATLRVEWIELPPNDSTEVGYLVREDWSFFSYENVRVLTPYVPLNDIQAPQAPADEANVDSAFWLPLNNAPYPAVDGALKSGGRRLTLPAPWTKPSEVTTFDDLAVFLRLTAREGSHGFGISEIADSTYTGFGRPVPHPLESINGETFTFRNAITAKVLTQAYLIVDWESGGASRRSWARVTTNTATTFTTDASSWLGDGKPPDFASSAVTLTGVDYLGTVTPKKFQLTNHGLSDGDAVVLDTDVGTDIVKDRTYYVEVLDADHFLLRSSPERPAVPLTHGSDVLGIEVLKVLTRYTCWIPHHKDNPHMWLPGPEFGYPNEDQQPRAPYVRFAARGQTLYAHQSNVNTGGAAITEYFDQDTNARFGAMLPFAWRVSSSIGKRINCICLGINSTPLAPGSIPNYFAHVGVLGWWDMRQYGFGLAMEDSASMMSKRIKRLIEFMAPKALEAEGTTKTLRVLSACHVQGETDAMVDAGREIYAASITDYKEWLRDLITTNSLNPFAGEARLPFAQPLITRDPWETTGQGTSFQTFGVDSQGDLNDALRHAHTSDPFAGFTLTEDIPKLLYRDNTTDKAHFSGEGMAVQGARLAAVILDLLEYALTHSSAELSTTANERLLGIVNRALTTLGEGARTIQSLSENTAEAKLARMFLPQAVDQLLALRTWSWALRTEPAVQVKFRHPEWKYTYVVPGRAVSVVALIPPKLPEVAAQDIAASNIAEPVALIRSRTPQPDPYELVADHSGHRLIVTNVETIPGDVSVLTVTDGKLHPERLDTPPTLVYVDRVLDPERFSPSFSSALTALLASMLAPAIIKGDRGEAVAQRELIKAAGYVRSEAAHITQAEARSPIDHVPGFIADR